MTLLKFVGFFILSCLVLIAAVLGMLQLDWTKQKIQTIVLLQLQNQGIEASVGSIKGELPFKWTLHNITLQKENISLEIDTLRVRIALLPLLKNELCFSYFQIDTLRATTPPLLPLTLPPISLPCSLSFRMIKIDHLILPSEELLSFQGKFFLKNHSQAFFINGKASTPLAIFNVWCKGDQRKNVISARVEIQANSLKGSSKNNFRILNCAKAPRLCDHNWVSIEFNTDPIVSAQPRGFGAV